MEHCEMCSYDHKGTIYYFECSCAETERKRKENDANANKKGYVDICGEWVKISEWVKMQLIN